MKLTPKEYARVLFEALSEVKPSDEDRVIENLTRLLHENGHVHWIEEIVEEFRFFEESKLGVKQVELRVARDVSAEKQILEELNALLGKNLKIKKRVDEGIVGGVIIQTEDQRIDVSVKKQLRDLKKHLTLD